MRTPHWVSPVSSVPYTSVHSMVTRAGPWSQVSLALLASLLLEHLGLLYARHPVNLPRLLGLLLVLLGAYLVRRF